MVRRMSALPEDVITELLRLLPLQTLFLTRMVSKQLGLVRKLHFSFDLTNVFRSQHTDTCVFLFLLVGALFCFSVQGYLVRILFPGLDFLVFGVEYRKNSACRANSVDTV